MKKYGVHMGKKVIILNTTFVKGNPDIHILDTVKKVAHFCGVS
jgi:hypothetical protein